MRQISKQRQRQAFYGWIKWALVLAILFTPLFFDAWLSIQARHKDYEYARLNTQMKEILDKLNDLRVEEASKKTLDSLSSSAPALGLGEPDPDQVVRVSYLPEDCRMIAPQDLFTVATLQDTAPPESPEAPVQEEAAAPVVPATTSAPVVLLGPSPDPEEATLEYSLVEAPAQATATTPTPQLAIPIDDIPEDFELDASLPSMLESL